MRSRKPLEYIGKDFVCLEIGVWKGEFSKQILECEPKKLILVDPWLFQPEFGRRMYGGSVAKGQADMDKIYDKVNTELGILPNVEMVRGKSDDIHKDIEDGSLDWVYVDGNHEYKFVLNDLINFYPKIKSGGFITGDDYIWKNPKGVQTVRKAVTEFVNTNKLDVIVDGSQFIIKK